MTGFTKLFNSILHSTIWQESHETRLVWITMLAMSNRHGEVMASVPGLAHAACVTVDECREALDVLSSPDPDSRTPDHEGRRVEKIDGGWTLLNHGLYRKKLSADERREYNRKKQAEYRKKKKAAGEGVTELSNNVTGCVENAHIAEAEAEAESNQISDCKQSSPPSGGRAWKPNTDQLRINALFSRRPTTKWSAKELKAWKVLQPIDELELRAIETYYRSGAEFLRRDIGTLLNNWPGEVDRAWSPNGNGKTTTRAEHEAKQAELRKALKKS